MEAQTKRNIKSGNEFNHLFPSAERRDPILKRNATVSDTVDLVKQVVANTLGDTKKIAQLLKGRSTNETCYNIFKFVYGHIRYEKDKPGVEQVRRPARTWEDRAQGVDCDCYTTFISSILTNLGISHTLRITEYGNKGYFQHIYPIVPIAEGIGLSRSIPQPLNFLPDGKVVRRNYLVIDCVKDSYNAEEPYTNKKDYVMDLQLLNGFKEESEEMAGFEDYTVDGLGRTVRRRRGNAVELTPLTPANVQEAVKVAPVMVAPAAVPSLAPSTLTTNSGILKDGRTVQLSEETIPSSAWINTYGGSSFGKTFYDRKLLVNGVWDGFTALTRFVVRDGVLRGTNTKGEFFTNYGNGGPTIKVQGANIQNPGVALAGLGAILEINGLGEITANSVPSRMGLWIPYEVFLKLYQARGSNSTNGLEDIAGLLGISGLDALEGILASLGDFENEGRDDVNGLLGVDFEGIAFEELQGLGQYLQPSNNEFDSVLTIDGLGRVKRVVARKRSGRVNNATTQVAPVQQASPLPVVAEERKLGVYIPLNTLKNILKLRGANLIRLQGSGKKISGGVLPSTIDGLMFGAINGSTDGTEGTEGLGWAFLKKVTDAAKKATSFVNNNLGPVASFVPGFQQITAASNYASKAVNAFTPPSKPSGSNQLVTINPNSPATPIPVVEDYVSANNPEAQTYYDRGTNGLGGIVDDAKKFVTENPVKAGLIAGGLGLAGYWLWKNRENTKAPKKASKKPATKKAKGRKASKKSKVAKFQFQKAS